jgi:hypothetical protein
MKKAYPVAKDLLCSRFSFFTAACAKQWQEHPETPILLPDDDPEVFAFYLEVLYRDEHFVSTAIKHLADVDVPAIIQTWVLADKLGDHISANIVMDYLFNRARRCSAIVTAGIAQTLQYTYEHTIDASPLRQLLCDFLFTMDEKTIEAVLKDNVTPAGFTVDMALKLLVVRASNPTARKEEFCRQKNSEIHIGVVRA